MAGSWPLYNWSSTQPSATQAGVTGESHVMHSLRVAMTCKTPQEGALWVVVRDGGPGLYGGAPLWQGSLFSRGGGDGDEIYVDFDDLGLIIEGTAGNAMTIEFGYPFSAPASHNYGTVSADGETVSTPITPSNYWRSTGYASNYAVHAAQPGLRHLVDGVQAYVRNGRQVNGTNYGITLGFGIDDSGTPKTNTMWGFPFPREPWGRESLEQKFKSPYIGSVNTPLLVRWDAADYWGAVAANAWGRLVP